MAHLLDRSSTYKTYDPSNALGSILALPDQCELAWNETANLDLPKKYSECEHIVVAGMGGSGLTGYMIRHVFGHDMETPVTIINGYNLPKWACKNTLIIAVTYSGNTEEVLSVLEQAAKQKCMVLAVSTGGKIEQLAKKKKVPAYVINRGDTNPANEPRMGVGLMVFEVAGILKRLGYIDVSDDEVKEAIKFMRKYDKKWAHDVELTDNLAKKTAATLKDTIPMLVGSEHLAGNLRVGRNQFRETAKSFSEFFVIPELNHHLMEGLGHPKEKRAFHFLLFTSTLYHERNQKRHKITADVIRQNNIRATVIKVAGKTKLQQSLYMLQLTGYMSFYLAMMYKSDPSPIPWVDYFKMELG